MEFSRQVYWSGLPFPSPGDLPGPGIELGSPTLQADSLPSEPPGKPPTPFSSLISSLFILFLPGSRGAGVFSLKFLLPPYAQVLESHFAPNTWFSMYVFPSLNGILVVVRIKHIPLVSHQHCCTEGIRSRLTAPVVIPNWICHHASPLTEGRTCHRRDTASPELCSCLITCQQGPDFSPRWIIPLESWESNRQEGQGSPNGGNRLQMSDIFYLFFKRLLLLLLSHFSRVWLCATP